MSVVVLAVTMAALAIFQHAVMMRVPGNGEWRDGELTLTTWRVLRWICYAVVPVSAIFIVAVARLPVSQTNEPYVWAVLVALAGAAFWMAFFYAHNTVKVSHEGVAKYRRGRLVRFIPWTDVRGVFTLPQNVRIRAKFWQVIFIERQMDGWFEFLEFFLEVAPTMNNRALQKAVPKIRQRQREGHKARGESKA